MMTSIYIFAGLVLLFALYAIIKVLIKNQRQIKKIGETLMAQETQMGDLNDAIADLTAKVASEREQVSTKIADMLSHVNALEAAAAAQPSTQEMDQAIANVKAAAAAVTSIYEPDVQPEPEPTPEPSPEPDPAPAPVTEDPTPDAPVDEPTSPTEDSGTTEVEEPVPTEPEVTDNSGDISANAPI